MRPALIVSGVMALGTALSFGAAAVAATLLPGGTVVPALGGAVRAGVAAEAPPMRGPVWVDTVMTPPVAPVILPEPAISD